MKAKYKALYAANSSKVGMVQPRKKYSVISQHRRLGVDFYLIALADGRRINVTLGSGVLGTFKGVI